MVEDLHYLSPISKGMSGESFDFRIKVWHVLRNATGITMPHNSRHLFSQPAYYSKDKGY
jgi:hypothetical protein